MNLSNKLRVSAIAIACSLAGANAIAAPWVDTSDQFLRADIQRLADAGVITVPINTFPLMWSGIGQDLEQADHRALSPEVLDAFSRVNFYYNLNRKPDGVGQIKAQATSNDKRFTDFGQAHRTPANLQVSYSGMVDRVAYKIAASAHYNPKDGEHYRLDDSYVAIALGNWIITGGAQERWWGPGFDHALHVSNNARPMPAISISRNNPQAFETPWLSWIGPWNVTASISQMEKERAIPNPYLVQARVNFRPIRQLEFGLSLSNQLCGEGQNCEWRNLWDMITGGTECADGSTDCDPSKNTHIGNKLAGVDLRYNDTWFSQPIGIYYEQTCEDSAGPYPWDIADCSRLFGADTWIHKQQAQFKLYAEYSDTMVACGPDPNAFNCMYEHSDYKSGYRYHGRVIGSTYESDARSAMFGVQTQWQQYGLDTKLRWIQLNKDGKHARPDYTAIRDKEVVVMLSNSLRTPTPFGLLNIGADIYNSRKVEQGDKLNATVYASLDYRF
ncbi:capsule assembly Wzi family protein [Paraferrimonas sedimenticola]|uniref:Outer membrane protein in capsule/EPS biosynthesis locus n=1 Tax=Paraferrimonas sedimenticola TaxID=375674 RepID=A0AA37RWD0_9GAMM|nr:capsule assembly Wzi family protein [Paraferrimonas sedimenticola]GLP96890.1 outer membrane protein in capsule/EPS biosynthesis locus [Paraferrimonas sedimenticola]